MFAAKLADPGAVFAVVPHPGHDAQKKGIRPQFSLSSLASPACPRPSHLPALIFSLLPLFFSLGQATLDQVRNTMSSKPLHSKKSQCLQGWREKLVGRKCQLHNFIVSQLHVRLHACRQVHSSLSYRTAI